MADNNTVVHEEDSVRVLSRISWGAIFAGVMVALPLYFLLTLLGAALGLSVNGQVRAENIASAAALWAIAASLVSLFVGGFVASQCTVGEHKGEAAVYGVIVWGVLFGMLLWLTATGVRVGFHNMVGIATNGEAAPRNTTTGERPGTARPTAQEAQAQQSYEEGATRVTWWALAGTLLSMLAAVAGAMAGCGPTVRFMRSPAYSARVQRPEPVSRL